MNAPGSENKNLLSSGAQMIQRLVSLVVKRAVTAGLVLFSLTACRATAAISYQSWLAHEADVSGTGNVSYQFRPFEEDTTRSMNIVRVDNNRLPRDDSELDWEVPSRPLGGLIGYIDIQATNGFDIAYPVHARLIYSQVLKKDLIPPAGEDVNSLAWVKPMNLLNPRSPIRANRHTREVVLSEKQLREGYSIPLILPILSGTFTAFSQEPALLSCRLEFTDGNNRALERALLVELFHASGGHYRQGSAWVTGEAEADRLLREFAGIQDIDTVRNLPDLVNPYSEVQAIWVSSQKWQESTPSIALMRRLVLMGLWVYGRQDTVRKIREEIGLDESAVLLGGIQEPDEPTFQATRRSQRRHMRNHSLYESRVYSKEEEMPLENRKNLFGPVGASYVTWTLCGLIGFGLLAGIGLPIAFCTLKGSRRIKLWWACPAGALLVAVIVWVTGVTLLDRRPRADVTEFRLAYADWPEVCSHSIARVLNFDNSALSWRVQPGAFPVAPGDFYMNRGRSQDEKVIVRHGTNGWYRLLGTDRGEAFNTEFISFAEHEKPVAVTDRAGELSIEAKSDMRNVFVWHNGYWFDLGAIEKGDRIPLARGEKVDEIPGLPERLGELFGSDSGHAVYTTGFGPVETVKETKQQINHFPGSCVVIGIEADARTKVRLATKGVMDGRVIWVLQFPLTNQTVGLQNAGN